MEEESNRNKKKSEVDLELDLMMKEVEKQCTIIENIQENIDSLQQKLDLLLQTGIKPTYLYLNSSASYYNPTDVMNELEEEEDM